MSTSEKTNALIRSIRVLTTGVGEQHREHRYGSRLPIWWWVMTSRSWIKIPINAFLIEHRDGLVLFDTGLDPAIATDPDYISSALGRFLLRKIFRLHIRPQDALGAQLEALGINPASIKKAVISHLHFDHIGGIRSIPQAELLVSDTEWQQLSKPHPEREWVLREHIELPDAKWLPIQFGPTDDPLLADFSGCYDVMGDESMVCLPTPGHTPGSMSLLVRSEGQPPYLFIGDLSYQLDLLMEDQVPGIGEHEVLRSSYAKVRALKQKLPELILIPSHDFTVTESIRVE